MSTKKYRLITRSDFDGLVCGVLLKKLDMIDEIKFVHPKDMQDGLIPVTSNDITTNLPYVDGVYLAFDHHLSEVIRMKGKMENHIIDPDAPSAARVVYNYYGGEEVFPSLWNEMLRAVDKADSGRFDEEDVIAPDGWEMMNFIMDARTGLGRFRNFRISNYDLMMELIDYCTTHTIEEILQLPDVKERVELYKKYEENFRSMIRKNARTIANVLIVDLRDVDPIFPGNRFLKYAMYPNTNISIQIMWGLKKQNTVMTVGKSIFNRTSPVNIGGIMLDYGGGGHKNAGTCQVDNNKSDEILIKLIEKLKE